MVSEPSPEVGLKMIAAQTGFSVLFIPVLKGNYRIVCLSWKRLLIIDQVKVSAAVSDGVHIQKLQQYQQRLLKQNRLVCICGD